MNGGKDWSKVDVIKLSPNAVLPGHVKKSSSTAGSSPLLQKWVRDAWAFAKEDTNRVAFSLKVGVAMLLVSLLNLMAQPFKFFGNSIVLAILTVGIMIEYTVGATLNRGFNRAVGSLLAGIFAIIVIAISTKSGHVAEPYVVGFSIFLVGTVTSFMKLWPSCVPYDYGFRVILFAYCLIIVSGYREGGDQIRTATDKLYSIAIGGVIAVSVNLFVCPVWAGEQLHKELVNSFYSVADSLEECVNKYLNDDGSEQLPEFSWAVINDFPDEPAFRKCMATTLNSSARIDSLASSARWEPPHGRFRLFFHPWSEYVKVDAVLRHCAYEVMALHGCLHSEIQAPYNLRVAFQSEILEATVQAAELVRSLAGDINNMKHNTQTSMLRRLHSSTNRLQRSIQTHSYLLTSSNSMITSYYCPISKPEANCKLMDPLSLTLRDSSDLLDKLPTHAEEAWKAGSYHETMRKQQRRLYSWPSRAVDDEFEEDGSAQGTVTVPRMRAFESTAALSLATFTSLLIEFIARLDHLVDAVDELAVMARFKQEASS